VQPRRSLFTSESVSMGHPDKAADQVSDSILDAALAIDPAARVACEVLLTQGLGVIAGEITVDGSIDYEAILRATLASVGYTSADVGFDAATARILVAVHSQSPDIAMGVDRADGDFGAGDQGLMFGYACTQTPTLMPLPITLSHDLMAAHSSVRETGTVPFLRPDAKGQVTVRYAGRVPVEVDSVVLSTQHGPEWTGRMPDLKDAIVEHVVRPALGDWWSEGLRIEVNPTGRFEHGGPAGDTGLTGRKIIVDTYGGWARHGGGAFSGKDPTKVDRSATYMARHIAKTVVAAGIAEECEVRLGYAIGHPEPTAFTVDCLGSTDVDEAKLERVLSDMFPLTPAGIIAGLDLRRPIYRPTSYHGHFGREPDPATGTFTWERTDSAEELRRAFE
jgi:S-adenosylmethionine synthetase